MEKQNKTGKKFHVALSKEELSHLPTQKFEGEIIIIEKEEDLDEAINELKNTPLIGFDTETKPSFKKGQINNVALIQLATESKCFLIRLNQLGFPRQLKELLENERILKIGLSIKDDFHNLSKICQINPKGFIDLQEYVRQFMIDDSSLTKIHAAVFGKRISKSQQLSNWEAPELTKRQQEYAALDALACIQIYRALDSGEFNPETCQFYKEIPKEENK